MNRAVGLFISVGGFLLLLAGAVWWAIPHMEDDLTERAMAGLSDRGVDGAEVSFDGRDGTLTGSNAEVAQIAIEDLRGARSIEANQTEVAEIATTTTNPTTTTAAEAPAPAAPTTTTTPAEPISLDIERSGQSLVLTGTVGTQTDRDRLVNEAAATGFLVDDRLEVDEAVDSSGRIPMATSGLLMALFVGSDDGKLRIRGTNAELTATAKDPVEAASIQEAIEVARRRGLDIEASVPVRELSEDAQVVALQSEIDQIFELSRIIGQETPGFGYSSEELNDVARQILDRVVIAMRRYPKPAAEIVGHTDSDGSTTFNQQLSVDRAQTVADYLDSGGIEADRLTVSGRGETEPVADNATAIGRLENRRVNFIVGKRAS